MSQDFKPIFDYLDEIKKEIKTDIISELGGKIDKLQTSVDGFAKSSKKTEDELLTQTHRVDPSTIRYGANKLEEWAKSVGEKLQMPLVQ